MNLISLEKNKNILVADNIEYFLNPDFIYIPADNILVKQDSYIYKNMLVCKHYKSPISGIAYGMAKKNSLVIKNDFRELENDSQTKKHKVTIKNILKYLDEKDLNLINKFKSQNKFTNIVISAINDEPYIYNNIYILKENITDLLELFDELSIIYKSDNNYLVVKNIDTAIINDCLNTIGTYPNINLTLVSDEYLLEKEEFLKEKLEIKDSTLYLTTKELYTLNNILSGKEIDTILLTIAGDAIKIGKVLRIKKYTKLIDVINKYITITTKNYDVIVNGLMQGYLIKDIKNFVIDENVYAINIMKKSQSVIEECINCGKCIEICPKGVNPITGKNKEKCIDCGLCSYICPGYVNLRQ